MAKDWQAENYLETLTHEKAIWNMLTEQQPKSLPAAFIEMEKLVDPASQEGVAFQRYMEALTHKILPGWDFKSDPVQFLISDTKDVNAGVITKHEPPLVIFNKGLLKIVGDNENMLLGVLGHELGHDLLRQATGNINVTKPEEILVSMPSIQWMYENGINPQPMLAFAELVSETPHRNKQSDVLFDMAIAVTDEHLTPAFDVDMVNNALVAYRSILAGSYDDRAQLTIPPDIKEMFATVRHVSPVTRARKQLEQETGKPFVKHSWEDQLAFITEQAAHIGEGDSARRAYDLNALLEKIDNPVGEISRSAGKKIVMALNGHRAASRMLLPTLNINLFGQGAALPPPPLDGFSGFMRNVRAASDYDAFCKASADMMQIYEKLSGYPIESMEWPPSFTTPSRVTISLAGKQGLTVPWNQHVKWAMQASEDGNIDPAKALVISGIEDQRLYRLIPLDLLKSLYSGLDDSRYDNRASDDEYMERKIKRIEYAKDKRFYPLFPLTARLDSYNLDISSGDGKLFLDKNPRWDANLAIYKTIERKRTAVRGPIDFTASPAYQFKDELLISDSAGMEKFVSEHYESLKPPELMVGNGTGTQTLLSTLKLWNQEPQQNKTRIIDAYIATRDSDTPAVPQRYRAHFLEALLRDIMPFERQTAEVIKLFEATLAHGGAEEKEAIRAFYLNPPEKPGFGYLFRSKGEKEALLGAYSPHIDFLAKHPGLFSFEEKGAILLPHIELPHNDSWWAAMLEAKPIKDLQSLAELMQRGDRFFKSDENETGELTEGFHKNFADILNPYFNAITGYNYEGALDIAPLLTRPSQVLRHICNTEPMTIDGMEYIDFSHFIGEVMTAETQKRFTTWCAEHDFLPELTSDRPVSDNASTADMQSRILAWRDEHDSLSELNDDLPEKLSKQQHAKRQRAYAGFLSNPEIRIEIFTDLYMGDNKDRPPLPIDGAETMRDVLTKHAKAQQTWPESHQERAIIFKTMDRLDIFPDYEWMEDFRNRLVIDLQSETDREARMRSLQIILEGELVKDPALRNEAVELWAKTLKENQAHANMGLQGGMDDGSAAYTSALTTAIGWAEEHVVPAERHRLFRALAEEVESQRDLSYTLRDALQLKGSDLQSSDKYFRAGEAVLIYAAHFEDLRAELLDYLLQEPSAAAYEQFGRGIKNMRKNADEDQHDVNLLSASTTLIQEINDTNNPQYYELHARSMHNNFRQAPLPVRIAVLDQLLIAPEEKNYSTQGYVHGQPANKNPSYDKAFNYVADKLLPSDLEYSRESRIILETYKNILPPNEQAFFIAAILAANDASKEATQALTAGERLAIVLEIMGPAEVKFGQGISNHSDAPQSLRQPMVRLTKRAAPSERPDIWKRYDECVPEQYRGGITRLGEVVGNGTFQEGIRAHHSDGSTSIMKLQRSFIERRAQGGFERLGNFVHALEDTDVRLGPEVSEAIQAILSQAKLMAPKETDVEYRLKQVRQAEGYYNPMKISADGYDFSLGTAAWLAYGVDREDVPHRTDRKEWCDEKEMPGVHFDELPDATPQQRAYKKAVAKAIVTAELMILLSGRPIDHDRHTAQARIQGGNIGFFDHGALDLEYPSLEVKQALAQVLVNVTQDYKSGVSVPELFYKELQEFKKKHGTIPDYLVKVERGALAMTPFFEQLEESDLKETLAAIHKAGKIHPDILNAKVSVNAPIIGQTTLKLSQALQFALPKKTSVMITTSPAGDLSEPLRFDYDNNRKTPVPSFPGIKPAAVLPEGEPHARLSEKAATFNGYTKRIVQTADNGMGMSRR